jgi:hypothetical protein
MAALCGCTATVSGHGSAADRPAPQPTPAGSSTAPGAAAVPRDLVTRTPVSTAIGDPMTAQLCATLDTAALGRALGVSAASAFPAADEQRPGCALVFARGDTTAAEVVILATAQALPQPGSVVTRHSSGLVVRDYDHSERADECDRDVLVRGAVLRVSVLGVTEVDQCAGADAAVASVAAAVVHHHVTHRPLPRTSVLGLDACKVAAYAGIDTQNDFRIPVKVDDRFGGGCEYDSQDTLYLSYQTQQEAKPSGYHVVRVEDRSVWASDSNGPGACGYLAVLPVDSTGAWEAVTALASADPDSETSDLCDETGESLVLFLDAAGL